MKLSSNFMRPLAGGVLGLLLACLGGCGNEKRVETISPRDTTSGRDADEVAIRALFNRYWRHIANKEADQYVVCLDKSTLEWNESLRKDALSISKEDFAKRDLFRRFKILQWRSEFDKATLAAKSGRELLGLRVSRGWGEHEAKTQWTLTYIGSNGKSAHAMVGGMDVPVFFFEKEPDGWKFNETKLYESSNDKLKIAHARTDLDETAFLRKLFATETGQLLDERLFDGPLEKLGP